MRYRHCFIAVAVAFLLLVAVVAQAHVPYLEPETLRKWGDLKEGEDFSFENPFIIDSGRIWHGKAVFAYLHKGDVDVYKYTYAPGETNMIMAGALAGACKNYRNFYPATALIGPGLPPPDPADDLPFEIPEDCEDCGVLVAWPIHMPGNQRPVFPIPDADYAWFFPSDFSAETIMVTPSEPGDYYIVIWNPTGESGDYTASLGIEEVWTHDDEVQRDLIRPLFNSYKTHNVPCKEVTEPLFGF